MGPNLSGWDDRIHQINRDFHDEVVGIQVNNQAPVVTITTPTNGLLTRTEATVSGTVTDALPGLTTLQAWLDGGPHFNVTLDASGHFQFDTSLPTDGSADGRHVVTLQATDNAGNVSSPATVSFRSRHEPAETDPDAPGSASRVRRSNRYQSHDHGRGHRRDRRRAAAQARIDGGPISTSPSTPGETTPLPRRSPRTAQPTEPTRSSTALLTTWAMPSPISPARASRSTRPHPW